MQLNRSLEDQSARQRDLDAREAMLIEQFQALEDLRARLEASEQALLLRAEAVSHDEAAAGEQEERKWTKLAALFGALAPAEAGVKITAYPPAEATSAHGFEGNRVALECGGDEDLVAVDADHPIHADLALRPVDGDQGALHGVLARRGLVDLRRRTLS
jgi:hypothetical protein